ncbi:hypothetical protein ABPG75_006335 [Micractinium tetrahymenae]
MATGPEGAAGAALAPSLGAHDNEQHDGRAGAAGSPTAHLTSPATAAAAVAAPGSPPSPPSPSASSNGGERMQPVDSKLSMASEGSELGKEGSTAGSVYDSASSTAGSGSGGSGLAPHYDANQDVIMRLEFLRAKEIKAIIRAVRVAVVAGLVMLIVTLVFRIEKADQHYLRTNTVPIVNLAFACPLLAAELTCFLVFFYRVYRSNLSGKRWSHRRRRGCTLAGVEVTLQLVNLVFFVVPNAYVLAHQCSWFHPVVLWSGFVRWTVWNTLFLMFWVQGHSANPARGPYWGQFSDRSDAAILDAPLWAHWRKLPLWCASEAILLSLTLMIQTDPNQMTMDPSITDCRYQNYDCSWKPTQLVLLCLNVTCLVVYWILYMFNILRAFNNLQHRPYSQFRMANLTVRLQVRMRSLSIGFFVLCVIVYSFVKLGTCSSFVLSWFGYVPMQVVMTVTAIANAFMYMPKRPLESGILQVWLQEFAWTEGDVPRKLEERASSLDPSCPRNAELAQEPIFCFETAVKAMFWSFLVYDYGERNNSRSNGEEKGERGADGSGASAGGGSGGGSEQEQVDAALALWDLEHFELFWERSLDTKAVVGWSEDTVVIAFRGTASFNNVRSDLQVWRARWPTYVGSPMLGTAPMVHKGFIDCYCANDFNEKLLSRIEHILYRCSRRAGENTQRPVRVVVTGHSLGGALAMLCAFDALNRCPGATDHIHVMCYTFGAPRPGNRAFARLYDRTVPDTWCLINNDDVVTKAGKFWFLYARCGHRVLLNRLGDMLVRPNYVETVIRSGGASVRDHLLTSYQKAIVSVVAAQFGQKSLSMGREGVLSLTQRRGMRHVLQAAGLSTREIRLLQERGWEAWRALQQARRKQASKRRRQRSAGKAADLEAGAEAKVQARVEAEAHVEAEAPAMLQAVIVEPAEQAEVAAPAAAAVAEAAPDVEAQQAQQETAEDKGGVLHVSRPSCRLRGRKCRTICTLLGKGAPVTPEPPTPLDDPVPLPPQQKEAQLTAIAEEEGEDGKEAPPSPSPPSSPLPPASPLPGQQLARQEGWWQSVAAKLGWDAAPSPSLGRSLSSASSEEGSGDMSDTRGPSRYAPALPLVLDWGPGSARHAPEALMGDAVQEHAAQQAH